MDTSRILFSCITPEGKDTFTAVLQGESPSVKRKVTFVEPIVEDDNIEDSPIPADYSGPKVAKIDETTMMEQLAQCQRIHDEQTAIENLSDEQIQLLVAGLPQFSRECQNCCFIFDYHDPTEACLCPACLERFTKE